MSFDGDYRSHAADQSCGGQSRRADICTHIDNAITWSQVVLKEQFFLSKLGRVCPESRGESRRYKKHSVAWSIDGEPPAESCLPEETRKDETEDSGHCDHQQWGR